MLFLTNYVSLYLLRWLRLAAILQTTSHPYKLRWLRCATFLASAARLQTTSHPLSYKLRRLRHVNLLVRRLYVSLPFSWAVRSTIFNPLLLSKYFAFSSRPRHASYNYRRKSRGRFRLLAKTKVTEVASATLLRPDIDPAVRPLKAEGEAQLPHCPAAPGQRRVVGKGGYPLGIMAD